jgi:DNA-binding phage protein
MNIVFSVRNSSLSLPEKVNDNCSSIILDIFEKKDQNIDANQYLNEIVVKADEFGVIIYLEAIPRYKNISSESKKAKITSDYLYGYFQNFGFNKINGAWMKRVPNSKFANGGETEKKIALPDTYASYEGLKPILEKQGYTINKVDMDLPVGKLAKGMSLSEVAAIHGLKAENLMGELKMGIETEMEHTDAPEYARAIALDHLYEDPKYYTKLKQMEGIDAHLSEISKKYAEGGTIDPIFSFKTPTGETSRLSYLQQVLVRTKGFKEYFGDWEQSAKLFLGDQKKNFEKHYKNVSKVIDYVTLEPRVVYHGTRAQEEFFRFDVTKEKGVGRPYGYFAHNREYSENFTQFSQRTTSSTKPFLYQCFISVKNPFYATTSEYWQKNRDAEGWKNVITGTLVYDKYKTIEKNEVTSQIEKNVESQIGSYIEKVYSAQKSSFWRLMAADIEKDFKFFLMAYGYDGVFYGEELSSEYDPENPAQYTQAVTIFDSKQVKLADGRNLNFNPLLDDIRYEEGGIMHETENNENIPNMNKKAKLGMLMTGGKYEVGGTVVTEHGTTNDGKKGGYFHGRSHDHGGIKAINKDTGQMIEVEGEEVIITKDAVNDTEKREFEGKMLTNREILSRINQSGGGVAFEDGGELKGSSCGCSGKKYKFGGQMVEDFHIIRFLNDPKKLSSYTIKNSREFADSLVAKLK